MVRTFAVRLLNRLGYNVLAFGSGADALRELTARTGPIDLLITDMVMPGMNGRVLAERMRQQWPGLEGLFTSGYSEQLIARRGVLDSGIEFLPKPYSIRSLAEHVRRLLDKSRFQGTTAQGRSRHRVRSRVDLRSVAASQEALGRQW